MYLEFTSRHVRRFWWNVAPPDANDCRDWLGETTRRGYGVFSHYGRRYFAHRIAFILMGGMLTDERPLVCHSCNRPVCCSPEHLYPDNNTGNMRYMVEQGRHGSQARPEALARGERHGSHTMPERWARGDQHGSRTMPERRPYGERNGTRTHPERVARGKRQGAAKLTDEEVRQMRAAHAGGATFAAIARQFGVVRSTAARAVKGKYWTHVE